MQSSEHFNKSRSVEEILREIRNEILNLQRPADEILLHDEALCAYLNISKRHSANLRAQRQITYSKSGGRIYYKLSDVLDFINKNQVKAINTLNRFK